MRIKESKYLGLGKFLITQQERQQIKEVEKELQEIKRQETYNAQKIKREKELTKQGYTKDQVQRLSKAQFEYDRLTRKEKQLERTQSAYNKAMKELDKAKNDFNKAKNAILIKPSNKELYRVNYSL